MILLFFEEIGNQLHDTNSKIIMVGDFNSVIDGTLDRKGKTIINYHPQAAAKIQNLMDSLDLVDIWRLKNPDLIRYTWRRQNQASRIDYFLISFSLVLKVTSVSIKDKVRSDHHLISLDLSTVENRRGPGYWKFNQSLLLDEEFIKKTERFISDYFTHNNGTENPLMVWDAFKCTFRGHELHTHPGKIKTGNQKRKP